MNPTDQIPEEIPQEVDGGMKAAAFALLAALLVLTVVGCVAVKSASAPVAKVQPIIPVQPTIRLTWYPNYPTNHDGSLMFPNCATVILRTADLTVPQSVWPACFIGQTNQCSVPIIGTMGFFAATNELTTN